MNKSRFRRIISAATAAALTLTFVSVNPVLAVQEQEYPLNTMAEPQVSAAGFTLSMDGQYLTEEGGNRLFLEGDKAIQSVTYTYDSAKVTVDANTGAVSLAEGYQPTGTEQVSITANVTYYNPDDVVFHDGFEGNKEFLDDTYGGAEKGNSYQHSATNPHWGSQAATPVANKKGPAAHYLNAGEGTVIAWFYDTGDTTTAEIKLAFDVNQKGAPRNHALGVTYDGTNTFTPQNKTNYSKRSGGSGYGWDATSIARTAGWHQLRWDVTSEGIKGYIDIDGNPAPVFESAAITNIEYVAMMTNWNNQHAGIADKMFFDDVTVLEPNARTQSDTATLTVTIKPNVEYTLTGDTSVIFDKAATPPAAVQTTVSPAIDEAVTVSLNGTTLTENTEYTVSGNNIVFSETYIKCLANGEYRYNIAIANKNLTFAVTVVDTSGVKSYYFSNNGNDETGDGSEALPWASLDKLNSLTLNPGDTVYLDAQSTWVGRIKLKDSGAPGQFITLTKYNDGGDREKRPVINGGPVISEEDSYQPKILSLAQGAESRAMGTVEVWSASYIKISGLEVTNNGGEADKDRIIGRNGILVIAEVADDTTTSNYNDKWEAAAQRSIYIDDCYVHDVNSSQKYKMSGGINFFGNIDDILVENCTAIDCDMEGIRNAGLYNRNNNWPAVHDVVFRNNYIARSAGDGMVISNVLDSTISGNVVTECGKSFAGTANYAALWLIGAKNTVVEGNEVFNNKQRCNDGEAFDFDYNCEDSIYQYNYTHHNVGGVILFMGTPKNNIFRYNISVEDGNTGATKPHLFFYAGAGSADTAPYIYNNVFMVGPETTSLFDGGGGGKYVYFYNNILMSTNGNVPKFIDGSVTGGFIKNNIIYPKSLLNATYSSNVAVADNLFVNPKLGGPGSAPENIMLDAATANAGLDLSKLSPYKLMAGSPAVNAGLSYALPRTVDQDRPVTRDFFENPIVGAPDIGVHEYTNDAPDQTVQEVMPESIAITADKTEIMEGDKAELSVTATPTNAWNNAVTWSVDNSSVATVSEQGQVKGVQAGTAVITATSMADPAITDTITIIVTEPPQLVGFRVKAEHNYVQDTQGLQLSVVGVDQYGDDFFVSPADIQSVQYITNVGTVDANGLLTIPQGTPEGAVSVTAKVVTRNYDYIETFEGGNTLVGGTTTLVRTTDNPYDGRWGMVTRNTSGSDDDAVKTFADSRQGTVTIMFYDVADNKARNAISVSPDNTLYAIGIRRDLDAGYYYHRIAGDGAWTKSSVQRTTGWHEFKWVFSDNGLSVYIDGTLLGSNPNVNHYKIIGIMARSGWSDNGNSGFYVDAIKAWTDTSGTTEHTTAALSLTANPAGTCEIYVTAPDDIITTNYGTLQMSAQYLPVGSGEVSWSVIPRTGNATIDQNGLLTAISNGTVAVRAADRENNTLYGERIITISGSLVHVQSINVTLVNGENPPTHDKEKTQILAKVMPENAGNKAVTWSISNPDGTPTDLATISASGVMSSWKDGTVRVTATSKETPTVSGYLDILISGQQPRVSGIEIADPGVLGTNATMTLTAEITPANAADKTIIWSITNQGETEAAIEAATGILTTGTIGGEIVVEATAQDGSGVKGQRTLTISAGVVQDNADIASAKLLVEGAAYVAAQTEAGTEAAAAAKAESIVNALTLNGVTAQVVGVSYTAAVAGTADHTSGTAGRYVFAVTMTKGLGTAVTTAQLTMTITATAYVPGEPEPPYVPSTPDTPDQTTTTAKNPDGSITTTVTDKKTGTVTETTTATDGTKAVVETKKDGSVTASVTLAKTTGETATLPVKPLPVGSSSITVTVPKSSSVIIPVADSKPGVVAVIVKADGTEEIVKKSVTDENGVALTLEGTVTVKLVDNSKSFADVPETGWAADAVAFATSRELFQGTGADSFSPNGDMTRAMLMTVLARFDGQDTTEGETWYSAGMNWATEAGLSDGSAPDASITREQMVVMLYRYAQHVGMTVSTTGTSMEAFEDADSVSDWASDAMAWAVNAGIITGETATTLMPGGSATRAEVATILMRFVGVLNGK